MNREPTRIETGGRTLLLRSPGAPDAAALLDFLKAVSGESPFLVSYPDEVTYTLAEEAELLEQYRTAADRCMFTVFDGALAVGNVGVTPVGPRYKVRHRASLGIAVRRELWGLGLGRLLMREAEAAARTMDFMQLELGVFSDNARAIRLYETEGYAVYGTVPDALRLRDGTFRDELLMFKRLRPAFSPTFSPTFS